ncbi:MAG: ABC transporter substrate-binding protein [Microcella sp.]
MPRSRGSRAVALAAGTAAIGLFAAGCAAPAESSDAEVVELRMLVNISPVLTVEYWESLVAPFEEANPNISVVIEVPSADDIPTTVQQQLASGDTADVVGWELGAVVASQLTTFPEEDWVLSTPLVEESRVNGEVKTVHTSQQTQSLVFYNVDAFAAAGIEEVPASVEEFTEALRALAAAGFVPLQTSGEWTTGPQFTIAASPDLLGNEPDFFAQRNAGDVTFVDSAWEEYLQFYETWIAEGLVPSDALGVAYPDGIAAFASGNVGAYIMPAFVIPTIEDAAPAFEVGVAPTPTLDGSTPKQVSAGAQSYSIMADSPHQEEALALVEYLVSDEDAIRTALETESTFRAGISYEASPLTMKVAEIVDAAPGQVTGTATPETPLGFQDAINTAVQALYTGSTARAAMEALDEFWDANAL